MHHLFAYEYKIFVKILYKVSLYYSGAIVIEGGMRLSSEMGRAEVVFTAEGEAYIDFETDVDFYESPFKMCMQMKRPKSAFK